jgi:hypothetical protein
MPSVRSLSPYLAALAMLAVAGAGHAQSVLVRGTFNGIPYPPTCAPPPAQSILFSLTPPPARLQAQFACNTAPTALQFTCLPAEIGGTGTGVSAMYDVRPGGTAPSELVVECPVDASTAVTNLEVSILDLFPDLNSYRTNPGADLPSRTCLSAAGQTVSRATYDAATRILSFDCVDGPTTTTTQCFSYDGIAVSLPQSTNGLAYGATSTNTLVAADCIAFGANNDRAGNSPALIPRVGGVGDPDVILIDGFEPADIAITTTAITALAPTPATIGEPYTVSVRVSTADRRPAGVVLVSDAAGANCTATLAPDGTNANAAIGSCSLTSTAAGTRTVRATYPGRVRFDGSTSTAAQTVGIGNQVITFSSPAQGSSITYSPAGTFPLVASGGNSGLPVVFASTTTGTCTVSGSTATIVAAGACSITANQAGNANYNPASQVTRNVTIAQAPQVITFPDPGAQPFGATFQVAATGGASGNPVVFSSTNNARCTVSGTTVTPVAVNTCTIRAQQFGNANYATATPVERQITITKGNGSLTFPAQGPFALTGGAFALSFTPGPSTAQVTFVSLTPSVCTVSGSTVTPLTTGSCAISGTHEEDNFYFASPSLKREIIIN